MTGTVQNRNIVRRPTEGVIMKKVSSFSYFGTGVNRAQHIYRFGAWPDARSFHLYATQVDGVLTGDMVLDKMRNTVGTWFSLKGSGRTVYLRGDVTIVVEGITISVNDFYSRTRRDES